MVTTPFCGSAIVTLNVCTELSLVNPPQLPPALTWRLPYVPTTSCSDDGEAAFAGGAVVGAACRGGGVTLTLTSTTPVRDPPAWRPKFLPVSMSMSVRLLMIVVG